ncbi:hypothetical protein N657DRAFT_109238 [Parathielavia appendiculata]|uniref:Zn(2)-C6 fungal-type domain-containing protein n=1 Tax=Parathielavia appendiculata TaxID=2587402 RepID=A0AAN6TVJ4_9PEZI|nr:hypothetical protein N657DRAFT_109238 [Parathielavia appendiculata]
MAPTKKKEGTATHPIDLTASNPVVRGRVTKGTPRRGNGSGGGGRRTPGDGADPNPPKLGKESGPACLNCKKNKARCDRVLACEKCVNAGVVCREAEDKGKGKGNGNDGCGNGALAAAPPGKPLKACARCKEQHASCVRGRKCVRCDKRGLDCVIG